MPPQRDIFQEGCKSMEGRLLLKIQELPSFISPSSVLVSGNHWIWSATWGSSKLKMVSKWSVVVSSCPLKKNHILLILNNLVLVNKSYVASGMSKIQWISATSTFEDDMNNDSKCLYIKDIFPLTRASGDKYISRNNH